MKVPLHPFVVHFPVALSFILPVLALILLFFIWKEWGGRKIWIFIIFLQLVATGGGFLAQRTGHEEEERVEKVLAHEETLEKHEEMAEAFVWTSVVSLGISVVGLFLPGKKLQLFGTVAYLAASIASAVLVANTGKLGGELVYTEGAARAYYGKLSEKGSKGVLKKGEKEGKKENKEKGEKEEKDDDD